MSEGEYNFEIDESVNVNPNEHSKLLKAISKLDKTQHIQKPIRDGNSEIKSEFHVSHSSHSTNEVIVSDLINILQKTSEHADTGNKIKVAQKLNETLPKPLEKHEAEKIKRATGFEEVKKSLDKWNAVVSRNRTLEHQKFPLNNHNIEEPKGSKKTFSKYVIKSELENELDRLQPEKEKEEYEEETFPMTMGELIEHRKETARLRAKQSYKEAKARRQGKIKSKKFHRIQRKERTKQQLKEFEQLQKTNPEEALKRLEQLEKTRAQERVTLRHKSTGQWAKNKLVRAKYDKETRQQLAEQLAISRELTQKQKIEDSESEEDKEDIDENVLGQDASNPWIPKVQQSKDVVDFVSGYKKYWEERNKTSAKIENKNNDTNDDKIDMKEEIIGKDQLAEPKECKINNNPQVENNEEESKYLLKKAEFIKSKVQSTSEWVVESLSKSVKPTKVKNLDMENKSLDEMFDDVEWKLQKSVSNKLSSLQSKKESKKRRKKHETDDQDDEGDDESKYLEFKKQKLRPEFDEELDESSGVNTLIDNVVNKKYPLSLSNEKNNGVVIQNEKIDPDKFLAIKPRHLMSALPDVETEGDHIDDDEDERKLTIAEAFEDDDIVAEFQQDKEDEVNKDKPKIEDIDLPGWGSWVGKNMKAPKRRRRMILNAPVVLPRKDDKKDNVIINENKSAKLRTHQVSELPFPFTSVGDYEATLRAPIGNTFIPESAHRKLIKPAVIVKRGIIIEPMDEGQLIVKKNVSIEDSDSNKPLFKKKNFNNSPRNIAVK